MKSKKEINGSHYFDDVFLRVGVYEDVEWAEAVQEGQEGDAGGDLPDHVPDLPLDLLLVLHGALHHLPLPVQLVLDLELPSLQRLLGLDTVQDNNQFLDLPQLQPVFNLRENIL